MKLRVLGPSDAGLYGELWKYAVSDHAEFFRTALTDDPQPTMPIGAKPEVFTVGAFDDGELIGIVSIARDRHIKLRHKALLFRMFVHPKAEGRGVGRALLAEVVARCKAMAGLRKLVLTVLASNERAQALYRSVGFREFARETAAVRIGDRYVDELQMELFLPIDDQGNVVRV